MPLSIQSLFQRAVSHKFLPTLCRYLGCSWASPVAPNPYGIPCLAIWNCSADLWVSALKGDESLSTCGIRSSLLSYSKYKHLMQLWCPKASETSALGWQSCCEAHALRAWCDVVAGGRVGCPRASHMGLRTRAWANKPFSDILSRFPWSILETKTPSSQQDTLNCLNLWTESAFGCYEVQICTV